jgi:hypothetical protein
MALISWFRLSGARLLLGILVTSLGIASAQTQQPLFPVPNVSIPLSPPPTNFAFGDFNGDGSPDLVYPDLPASGSTFPTITVLLNQGPSTSPIKVTTSGLSCTVQSALLPIDINNDKKTDLVFVCKEGYVTVLLGNGDGTFQPATYYALSGASSLAAVDLNGDGYLDIVASTATANGSAIAVLLNQGASAPGTLVTSKSYAVDRFGGTIGIGDFNGDGKQDILVNTLPLGSSGFKLAVLYGNGDGTLQTVQTIQSPAGGSPFVTSDLNHDGITDVAYLTNPYATGVPLAIQVVLGQSNGLFTVGSSLQLSGSVMYTNLVLAGTTNGGKNIDLAATGGIATILLGDGNGGFSIGHSYAQFGNAVVEPGTNGNDSLIFSTNGGFTSLTGNGDGTFQGIFATPVGPYGFASADLNNDGLTDLVFPDSQGNLTSAIGRGDGSFITTSGQVPTGVYGFPALGDFNADGKIDAVVVFPGQAAVPGGTPARDAQLFFYKGNGDGTFQPSAAGVDLQVIGAGPIVTGDFNGDGKLDVIVGLVFLPGNGDGSFGAPVSIARGISCPNVLVADLNKDGKLDLVCGAVFLGKGDGTFNQQPLGLVGTPLALADLNGDGIPDIVIAPVGSLTSQVALYAGRGDGSFQSSPFYTTAALTQSGNPVASASIGDVDGDGNPDLLIQYQNLATSNGVTAFLGEGQGNFTADSNTYFLNNSVGFLPPTGPISVLARLNNQAPVLASGHTLDYLGFVNGTVISLLNLTNPAPVAPSPQASKISLASSLTTAAPGQKITLTATVTGFAPTGSVTFVSGSTTLGTASVANGVAALSTSFATAGSYSVTASYPGDANNLSSTSGAVAITVVAHASETSLVSSSTNAAPGQQITLTATVTGLAPTGTVSFLSGGKTLGTASLATGVATLSTSFATAGSYSVTASYAGDANNLSSTSGAVTITVVAPDYSVTASPATATITAGQTATTTLTITPTGGYNGTVKFSCGSLPSLATCNFSPATVTPTNGAVTTTLTVSTTATITSYLEPFARPLQGIALALLFLVGVSPRRFRVFNQRLVRAGLLTLALATTLISLSGCSNSTNKTTTPGTPTGTQTIVVTAADSSGGVSHAINFQVTVQ